MPFCDKCGKEIEPKVCPTCGRKIQEEKTSMSNIGNDLVKGKRNKWIAIILAFFFGGLGIHKFYLGQIGWGVVYLLFCWTGIPSIISIIEAVLYLTMSDAQFAQKYK